MTNWIGVLLLTGAVGLVASATPADAQGTDDNLEYRAVKCANDAESSCNDDFPPNDWRTIAIRGWCYTIRTAMCLGSGEDPQPAT